MATMTLLGCVDDSGSPLDAYRSPLSPNGPVPTFAPDGQRIAYVAAVAGQRGIFVADAQLGEGVRVSFGIWDYPPRWSPDGQWLAFDRDSGIGDLGDVFMIPSSGGEEIPIAVSAASERMQGWLPDGSGVLYQRNQQTWVGLIDGGGHFPMLDISDAFFAVPSPDGRRVAYSRANGALRTIWLFDRESGAHDQLTGDGYEALANNNPWSPDGTRFGFRSTSAGTGDIWVADASNRTVRQLTRHLGDDFGWIWSPDGQWIAFVSDRGGQIDIWALRSDGSEPAIRVTDDRRRESNLAWSPDGSRLIFNHERDELPVGIVDIDGNDPHVFMTARSADSDFRLSPDESKVLFTSTRSGNQDLWSAPVGGGEPIRLTLSQLPDSAGRWSPDGQSIAFQSRRTGSWDIYTMSSEGDDIVAVTDWPGDELQPQWSPDGRSIAFLSNREAAERDIWIVPATGGEPARITHLDARVAEVEWSPDGQSLIFKINPSPSDPRETLNRVSSEGGPVLELFEGDFFGTTWSPDGRELALSIIEDGYSRLHVIPATGGTPRRLTNGELEWDFGGRWSADGREIVFNRQPLTNATGRGIENFIAAVSVADGILRTVVRDSTRELAIQPGAIDGSVLYTTLELDLPVDEVRIAELLADRGSGAS